MLNGVKHTAFFFYLYSKEWIHLQSYSGLVRCFLLDYQDFYYAVQKNHPFFMHRLLPDVVCL
jgi:hypothetical protein